ncbi:hypothetical protein ACFP8W_08195, partial [Nocardioides hankookensis]
PPPVPEVARTGNLPVPADPAQAPVRRSTGGSLVDSTAHLFASPDAPIVRRYSPPGGSSMSASAQPPASGHLQIRRTVTAMETTSNDLNDLNDLTTNQINALSDGLVDRVVERIERRVVEELERRGRRHGQGTF